jgi:hypothetical protein
MSPRCNFHQNVHRAPCGRQLCEPRGTGTTPPGSRPAVASARPGRGRGARRQRRGAGTGVPVRPRCGLVRGVLVIAPWAAGLIWVLVVTVVVLLGTIGVLWLKWHAEDRRAREAEEAQHPVPPRRRPVPPGQLVAGRHTARRPRPIPQRDDILRERPGTPRQQRGGSAMRAPDTWT